MDYWKNIGKQISIIYNKYHSKKYRIPMKQRALGIKKEFKKILDEVKTNKIEEAKKYIQKQAKQEIEKFLKLLNIKFKVFPASSFSAGTNLIGESDIDFNVAVQNLNMETTIKIANACGEHGYHFVETRNKYDMEGVHYVFQKYINKVEIEFKLRDLKSYLKIYDKMHHYLDRVISKNNKAAVTLIKYYFKKISKKNYAMFKALYYAQALANSRIYKLLYPLH